MADYYIFLPTNKDMKAEYPELNTIEEFYTLRNKELAFVWYMKNPTSPLLNWRDEEKIPEALRLSGLHAGLSAIELDNYKNDKFPGHIQIAMVRMAKFKPSSRMQGKIMYETMLSNLEKMVGIDNEVLSKMELSAKKEYSSLVKNINDVLPDLVSKIEEGFGVRKGKSEQKGSKHMDKIIGEGNEQRY